MYRSSTTAALRDTRFARVAKSARPETRDAVETEAAACAALTLCECLVIALAEGEVLSRRELTGALEDARNAHAFFGGPIDQRATHRRAADVISRIIESARSV